MEVKLNLLFGTHVRDITWWARHFDFHATRAVRHPVHRRQGPDPHVINVDPTGATERQGRRATTLRRVCDICSIDGGSPTNQQHNATLHGGGKPVKEFRSPNIFFLLLRIPLLLFQSMHSS
jgi:hypothetical protein